MSFNWKEFEGNGRSVLGAHRTTRPINPLVEGAGPNRGRMKDGGRGIGLQAHVCFCIGCLVDAPVNGGYLE